MLPESNPVAADAAIDPRPTAKPDPVAEAIAKLEQLAIGKVEVFESFEDLEAGCLSCSGVKITEE